MNVKSLQFVLKQSAFSFYACAKFLRHSRTAESIIHWSRSFQACMIRLRRSSTSRTFVLYTISCMHSHLIIDGIQILTVRGPQCRTYEIILSIARGSNCEYFFVRKPDEMHKASWVATQQKGDCGQVDLVFWSQSIHVP